MLLLDAVKERTDVTLLGESTPGQSRGICGGIHFLIPTLRGRITPNRAPERPKPAYVGRPPAVHGPPAGQIHQDHVTLDHQAGRRLDAVARGFIGAPYSRALAPVTVPFFRPNEPWHRHCKEWSGGGGVTNGIGGFNGDLDTIDSTRLG